MEKRQQSFLGVGLILTGIAVHLLSAAPPIPDTGTGDQLFYQPHPDGGQYRGPFFIADQDYYVLRKDGQRHVITRGRHVTWPREDQVLGLADLYTRTRLDPLFWSPFSGRMEFENSSTYEQRLFERAIEPGNQRRLARVRDTVLEDRSLLPEPYLRGLSTVDRRTDRFLDHPSYSNAEKMLAAYDVTAAAYGDAARSLAATLVRVMPHDEDRLTQVRFVQPSGTTMTTSSFITYLERIGQNAERLSQEVRDRLRLLEEGGAVSIDPRMAPSGGTVTSRERLVTDAGVRRLAGAHPYAGLDDDDRASIAGSRVEGPYTVPLPCRDEQRQVVRLSQDRLGSQFQYFLVDGVARSAVYPAGDGSGTRFTTSPRIIPADAPVNSTAVDGRARYAVEGFEPFTADIAWNDTGIGRGATFYWMNRSRENLGVLTLVEHQFAYWQCPLAASSRWSWHAIDLVHGRVADRRLGDAGMEGVPSPVRDAFGRVAAAEQAFLTERSQRTMRRLGAAYWDAVSALRSTPAGGAGLGDWERQELVDRAVFVSSRVSVMDEVFSEHSAHDHTFQSFRDQLGFSRYIKNVSGIAEARSVIGPREVLTYSFMDLLLAPQSSSVWRLEGWADPTVAQRARPRTVIYPLRDR